MSLRLGELVIDLVPEHRPDGRMAFAPKARRPRQAMSLSAVARLGGRARDARQSRRRRVSDGSSSKR